MFPEIKQFSFSVIFLFHPREQWLHPGYLAQYSEKQIILNYPLLQMVISTGMGGKIGLNLFIGLVLQVALTLSQTANGNGALTGTVKPMVLEDHNPNGLGLLHSAGKIHVRKSVINTLAGISFPSNISV
jgi:hypothetical protein